MNRSHRFASDFVRFIAEAAASDSARSLDLLHAIEITVDVNETLRDTFAQIAHRAHKITENVCGRQHESEKDIIDVSGEIRQSLESTMSNMSLIATNLKRRRGHAVRDISLRNDDGVIESFNQVIESIADAHNALNETSWAIMEHDADLSPRSGKGPFKTAKELIAALSD